MSLMKPENEYEALVHVMRRLSSWYPEVDEEDLLAATVDELQHFEDARMRQYVPLLIEHNLRARILRDSLVRAA